MALSPRKVNGWVKWGTREPPFPSVFLNTGHGTLGWTMACGSARAFADVILGRPPEIDLAGLTLDRST